MVEYALLLANLAGTSFRSFAAEVASWASGLNWHALSYGLLGLVAFRIAFWAFRPRDH
jgi:hypothetical protein